MFCVFHAFDVPTEIVNADQKKKVFFDAWFQHSKPRDKFGSSTKKCISAEKKHNFQQRYHQWIKWDLKIGQFKSV